MVTEANYKEKARETIETINVKKPDIVGSATGPLEDAFNQAPYPTEPGKKISKNPETNGNVTNTNASVIFWWFVQR